MISSLDQAAEFPLVWPESKGRAAPPPDGPKVPTWWEILGCAREWPLEAVELAYRTRAARAHPDVGGSAEEMAAANGAIEAARKEKA